MIEAVRHRAFGNKIASPKNSAGAGASAAAVMKLMFLTLLLPSSCRTLDQSVFFLLPLRVFLGWTENDQAHISFVFPFAIAPPDFRIS
jgi:hypothetical protein